MRTQCRDCATPDLCRAASYDCGHDDTERTTVAFTQTDYQLLTAFATWLLKDEASEGHEVELVDQFIKEIDNLK